jgi:hypothetical protein
MAKPHRLGVLGIILIAAAGGSYALAQPKAAQNKATAAARPGEATSCEGCSPDADKGKHGGMMMDKHDCPMMQGAAPMVEATVENTKQGAVIRLTAKNVADLAKVQQLAQKLAQHITTGCAMHDHDGNADHDHVGHEAHGAKH